MMSIGLVGPAGKAGDINIHTVSSYKQEIL
jgi:hypothetical protein|nr:hypothetical protein 495p1_00069 [Serratia proteamaculans]